MVTPQGRPGVCISMAPSFQFPRNSTVNGWAVGLQWALSLLSQDTVGSLHGTVLGGAGRTAPIKCQ